LNLVVTLDGVRRILRDQSPADEFTATGKTCTLTGVIAHTTELFRVTLAWTDAPGNTTGNAYNNDLDLTVAVGCNTYKGTVFSSTLSAMGGTADVKNNAESVFLSACLSNNFTVTVTTANINSDAVTNGGPLPEQDFALVICNGAQPPILSVSVVGRQAALVWSAIARKTCRGQYKTISPTLTGWR
jgi:hypothetical protein